MVIYNKDCIHIQYLLGVDGNILAGVFLTSFHFVPESSHSSIAARNGLLVAWSLVLKLL